MERGAGAPDGTAEYVSALYDAYKGLLYGTARRLCGRELDAEAAVSESILRLAKHVDTLRSLSEPALAVYLACTVQSVVYNKRRSLGVKRRWIADRDVSEYEFAAAGSSPEDEHIEREARQEKLARMRAALAELSEADRELLTAKYFAGMDDARLAAKYGITQGSVRSRLSRAKSRARKLLAEKEAEDARKNG